VNAFAHPSGNRTVIDGPFPESKQLIAGYWILQVPSMDEAVGPCCVAPTQGGLKP
jgi:hypothetical protein